MNNNVKDFYDFEKTRIYVYIHINNKENNK